jgi:hypothetical protein
MVERSYIHLLLHILHPGETPFPRSYLYPIELHGGENPNNCCMILLSRLLLFFESCDGHISSFTDANQLVLSITRRVQKREASESPRDVTRCVAFLLVGLVFCVASVTIIIYNIAVRTTVALMLPSRKTTSKKVQQVD